MPTLNFLAMMVRAPRAVYLVANSAAPLPLDILVAAKGEERSQKQARRSLTPVNK